MIEWFFSGSKIYEGIKNVLGAGGGTSIILCHCCEQDLNTEFKPPELPHKREPAFAVSTAAKLILKQNLLRALALPLAVKVFRSGLG